MGPCLCWTRALVSALYAGVFPEKVDRLVLLEGGSPLTLEPAKAPEQLRDHILATATMREASANGGGKIYKTREEMLRRLVERPLSQHAAECLLEQGTERLPDGAGWRFTHDPYLRLPSPYRMTDAHVWAFHARVVAPSLMVMATQGWPFPPPSIDACEAALREGNPHVAAFLGADHA